MRIGELAQRSGVAAHTIRFYESRGLLPPAERGHNGYRRYDTQSLEQLTLIQLCQRLGFNLDDIEQLMKKDDGWDKPRILANLNIRLEEIEQLQRSLEKQRQEILSIRDRLEDRWQAGECVSSDEIRCLSQHLSAENDETT